MQQVVGHISIHGSQRVVKEIEFLFLERGGGHRGHQVPGPLEKTQTSVLGCDLSQRQSEKTVQGNSGCYPYSSREGGET